jgi:chromosome segregation ATPase
MSDLKKAEAVVVQLEQKRSACIARGTELQDERANVALDAYTSDPKARRRLDEINAAVATHASELASLDAALRVAAERLDRARAAEATASDRAAAISCARNWPPRHARL